MRCDTIVTSQPNTPPSCRGDICASTSCTPLDSNVIKRFFFFSCSGYDDVPWNNPHVVAPNLAAMADRGVVLTNHYSQSVCSPARAALLTGYYPIRIGMQVSGPEECHGAKHELLSSPAQVEEGLELWKKAEKPFTTFTHHLHKNCT